MKPWFDCLAHAKKVLLRRGCGEQHAEDLVQEAFMRLELYRREHEVREPEAFLVRTAINLSVDAHRHDRLHPTELLTEHTVAVDITPSQDEVFAARERLDRVTAGLHQLSPRTRDIFLGHRVDGLSYKALAQAHGISISAVEKHIAKAVLFFSEWMAGW